MARRTPVTWAGKGRRGPKDIVLLGVHRRKRKVAKKTELVEEKCYVRMFPDLITALGWATLVDPNPLGPEISLPNKGGKRQNPILGSDGQQQITIVWNVTDKKLAPQTSNFRVPYWFPNYKIAAVLGKNSNIYGFRRNGRTYRASSQKALPAGK